MENPPISFLPNIPERVDYHPIEVSLPFAMGFWQPLIPTKQQFQLARSAGV
jgi:hypothetical protein